MDLKNKIIILDEVLTREECVETINFFKTSIYNKSPNIELYRDTLLLQVTKEMTTIQTITKKIRDSISFLSDDIVIDWCQIVEWNVGSKQQYHRDTRSDETVFTSITYLNDEYFGGQTQFLYDIGMIPKIGRTVYFDGNHYTHGVTQVTTGVRYTLPIWYKYKNENQ